MTKKDYQWFVDTVKNTAADYPCGSVKTRWLSTGRSLLKQLAKALNLPTGSYKVRVNKAGPAVSGDIILHGEYLYVSLTQGFNDGSFMWRYCDGCKDYTGRANHWASWEVLLDSEHFAASICEFAPQNA